MPAACLNQMQSLRMEEIFQNGLHEFITDFIASNNTLGSHIHDQYLT